MNAPAAGNAFGQPVPTVRQVAALDCAADVIGIDPMLATPSSAPRPGTSSWTSQTRP